jgi:thioredoxin-related protein
MEKNMKKTSWIMVIALMLCLYPSMRASAADQIQWEPNFDAAVTKAKATNKLIMADFYTDWCVWCKKLDSDVYTNPSVIQNMEKVVPVKVNAEKEGVSLAKKYNVTAYPTILFLNSDGTVIGIILGYEPADQFSSKIDTFVSVQKELPILQQKVKENPKDNASLLALAKIYSAQEDTANLDSTLTQMEKNGLGKDASAFYDLEGKLGMIYVNQNDPQKAAPIFTKMIKSGKTDPQKLLGRIGLGITYIQTKQIDKAKSEINKVLNDPKAPENLKTMAQQIMAYLQKQKQ